MDWKWRSLTGARFTYFDTQEIVTPYPVTASADPVEAQTWAGEVDENAHNVRLVRALTGQRKPLGLEAARKR